MKTDKLKKEGARVIMSLLLSLIGTSSEALCLKDCQSSEGQTPPKNRISFHDSSRAADSFNRKQSHDVSNAKNAMVGEQRFRAGHEHVEISNSNSPNSTVDASVTQVINLGDVTNTGDANTTINNYEQKK